jgi:histidinol-phosphate aminotransferase
MSVPGRIAGTVRADIRELAAYPVAHAEGCIKLDAMECPYELPEAVRDDIARAVRDTPLNRYPAADLSALQAAVKTAFGVPDGADVLFGNGSDELIHIVVQACCNPGDTVLSPWPSFVYFDMAARFDHARFVGVPLTADLTLDLPAMLAAIQEHQPKVVFLAVPNNPTGGLWSDEDVAPPPGWWCWTRPTSPSPATPGCRRCWTRRTWSSCARCPRSAWPACASATWPATQPGSRN